MTTTGYTHTERWLSSLKVGEKVLISYQDHPNEAESDAVVTSIGKKYIRVQIDENMPGHVWGKNLLFDRVTGQQFNGKVSHWVRSRRLLRITESRMRKIIEARIYYKNRMRISDALFNRRVPSNVAAQVADSLERWPIIRGRKNKKKEA